MQFFLDPSRVSPGPASWFFLLFLCIVLPAAAIRQHRMLGAGAIEISRLRIYASGAATHAVLLLLVWVVAHEQGFNLLRGYSPVVSHLLIGAAALALGIVPFLREHKRDARARARTRLIAPRTPREFGAFYLLCVTAGIAEELAYRGVLFTLLASLTNGWWVAAFASAACFGVAHLFQGWRSAGIATLLGVRDHIVVGLTGTLWVVIVIHMLHDVIAGTVIGIRRGGDDDPEMLADAASAEEVPHAIP